MDWFSKIARLFLLSWLGALMINLLWVFIMFHVDTSESGGQRAIILLVIGTCYWACFSIPSYLVLMIGYAIPNLMFMHFNTMKWVFFASYLLVTFSIAVRGNLKPFDNDAVLVWSQIIALFICVLFFFKPHKTSSEI